MGGGGVDGAWSVNICHNDRRFLERLLLGSTKSFTMNNLTQNREIRYINYE